MKVFALFCLLLTACDLEVKETSCLEAGKPAVVLMSVSDMQGRFLQEYPPDIEARVFMNNGVSLLRIKGIVYLGGYKDSQLQFAVKFTPPEPGQVFVFINGTGLLPHGVLRQVLAPGKCRNV